LRPDAAPRSYHFNPFPGASVLRQLLEMIKISMLQKYRAPTIWLEVCLPLMFFLFVCLFANRTSLWSDPVESPASNQYIPFSRIPGPSPQYGMIPDNAATRLLMQVIQNTSISPESERAIVDSSIFFATFDDFKDWIKSNREVVDTFFCVEWRNSNPPNFSQPDIRISTNGMTSDSLPDFVRTISSAFLAMAHPGSPPRVGFEYSVLPSVAVFGTNERQTLEMTIFSTVLFIPTILTAATNYGTEAESGLRDLFLAVGLSLSAHRLRWWLVCFLVSFVLAIPYAIVIAALLEISFFLLLLTFFLSASYRSLLH
jgi:hypothetical protein